MLICRTFQKLSMRAGKKRFSSAVKGGFIGLAGILTGSVLVGCDIPVPAAIGLKFTDEVYIGSTDMAISTVLAQKCRESGVDVDDRFMLVAVNRLTGHKLLNFEQERDRVLASDTRPTKKECRKLAKDMRRMQDKKVKITD